MLKIKSEQKLNVKNNYKYIVEAICNSKDYTKEAAGQLLRLYSLVFWKNYVKDKNIYKLTLAVI